MKILAILSWLLLVRKTLTLNPQLVSNEFVQLDFNRQMTANNKKSLATNPYAPVAARPFPENTNVILSPTSRNNKNNFKRWLRDGFNNKSKNKFNELNVPNYYYKGDKFKMITNYFAHSYSEKASETFDRKNKQKIKEKSSKSNCKKWCLFKNNFLNNLFLKRNYKNLCKHQSYPQLSAKILNCLDRDSIALIRKNNYLALEPGGGGLSGDSGNKSGGSKRRAADYNKAAKINYFNLLCDLSVNENCKNSNNSSCQGNVSDVRNVSENKLPPLKGNNKLTFSSKYKRDVTTQEIFAKSRRKRKSK